MKRFPETDQIAKILAASQDIVILQADNPDGDSLASALALEQILGDLGKDPHLYCAIDMPVHLRYLEGWDRVSMELPTKFDASVIVDTSAISLFERLIASGQDKMIAKKPCIVLDHHPAEVDIPFATVVCNQPVVATGELIYELAQQTGWKLALPAANMLASSIMSDSLGLTSEGASARSIHIIGELVEQGVSLAELEAKRRLLMRKSATLVRYKGELLQRIEYFDDNRLATITIPWEEIQQYSPLYNPSMLVIDDMRMSEGVDLAIAFKVYRDGKVTGKIRANYGVNVADKLAQHFGGGGHRYASGFKISSGRPFNEIKSECIEVAAKLLDSLEQD